MRSQNMIVLLTDFGQSEYVGVMKGVIYSIYAQATIADLCHDISPQSIIEASWILKNNHTYFPEGAVFCCVVDPGVGTERKALVLKTEKYYFVAPDNGLVWEAVKDQKITSIRQIPIPADASRTFHGRDVFAKAAARIDLGEFDQLGPGIEQVEKLELYLQGRQGLVVRIDRFGNVITNLPKLDKNKYVVQISEQSYQMNYHSNYQAAPENELFLIEGSCSTLEVSLKNGNANNKLSIASGERITIS